MTKKKPSPQNRIWEKERRNRLNVTFDSLAKLLPDYEPATQLSKIEVLQRTIEFVEKLQDKIKAFLEERDALLKEHVDELEERLQMLIARNEDLAALLKKANINVPPCKVGSIGGKVISDDKQDASPEAPKPNKKSSPKKRLVREKSGDNLEPKDPPKSENKSVPTTNSVIESTTAPSASACPSSTSEVLSCPIEPNTSSTVAVPPLPIMVTTSSSTESGMLETTGLPSTCLVMANNQIVGTLKQTSGVNVTPALLSTPIMATGLLISNNGSLLQMPLVPPSSSLLIVSNEDVRSRICLGKKHGSCADPKPASKSKAAKNSGKFSIKSIDVIQGRIVNGKIPIPPLKRAPQSMGKVKKETRKKRTKRKAVEPATDTTEPGESEPKRAKLDEEQAAVEPEEVLKKCKNVTGVQEPITEIKQTVSNEFEGTVEDKEKEENQIEDQTNTLDMNLDHGDLSVDIFANLQVPDGEADANQGSLSPTAAYLMNFPLVATGGKASGIQTDGCGDAEVVITTECDKKPALQPTNDNNLLLDNFSSYFGSSVYAGQENVIPEAPAATVAPSTNFSTIYQSIDSMLEHKTPRTTSSSDCRYNTTPFTFTLTSTNPTVSTQSSFDYRQSSTSTYFYPSPATTTKPIDDYCLLKPPIVSEFTFSLTSTTPSAPKTVQSQYTNSTIFSSTITTPSYSTYGYQSKNTKTANYNSYYIPETPKAEPKTPKKYSILEAEKPATNFTFSLTSTTKTLPKCTHSSVSTSTTACITQQVVSTASSCVKIEDCLYKTAKSAIHGHHQYKTPPKQKSILYSTVSTAQPTYQPQTTTHTQSKYDVNWMTSQDSKPLGNQDYNQILPSLDFNGTPSNSYQTNFDLSRKSDIFFAHPTGEDNLVTWSPNKLTNILNDTTSPYYPSTTTSLPNLNGDLALNSITNCQSTAAKATGQRKVNDSGSTFLSVQQLVDQPRKTNNKIYTNCASYSTNQKTLNNNYSAEALIAAPSSSSIKKDSSYNNYNTYSSEVNSGAGLSFNFDYSTDYNKNYNYSCQQNYMPSFMDNTYGLSTIPPPTVTTSSSITNYSSYSYSSDKKQQSSYYHSSTYQPASSDIPYYVPSSEKRTHQSTTTNKHKKHHKQLPSNDNITLPSTSSNSSYFPAILPPPPPPNLADDTLGYNSYSYATTTKSSSSSSCYNQSYHQAAVPNYSFGSGGGGVSNQSYPAHGGGNNTAATGNSLTNFNLSTICPEINDKSAASSSGPATIGPVRHAITGGAGW